MHAQSLDVSFSETRLFESIQKPDFFVLCLCCLFFCVAAWKGTEIVMNKGVLSRTAASCGKRTKGGSSGTFINAQDAGKQLTAAFAAAAAQMDRGYGIELESLEN